MYKTILAVLFIFISPLALMAQQGRGGGAGGAGQMEGDTPVSAAEISTQSRTISVGGRLEPRDRIIHQTSSAGFIESLEIIEGQFVREGQALFSINKDEQVNRYKPVIVQARISGMVSEIHIRERDEVRAGVDAVTIIGTSGYKMNATISDKDAFKIQIGQQVRGRSANIDLITGTLTMRSLEPDYGLGLFSLTLEFPNTSGVHVGEYLLVDLPIDKTEGIFIRQNILVRRYGKYFVWTVNSEDNLEIREVVPGASFGDLIKINEGIVPGDRYITRLTGREEEGAAAYQK
jgi:multidrug efflux pump subunit AcrA (membrane-fusion protein)